ncbi:MAG: trehalose-6-phosphate synthase [Rhodospirillales bacterium]|nr:trehalose-6-phosphate synthase [Rhodospirillales bacterium]
MNRLVVISNRVALPRAQGSAGGLAVALGDALAEAGGVWFGWSGKIAEGPVKAPSTYSRNNVRYVTADLTQEDFDEYYLGFSNSVLWPSFHFRLDLADFARNFFRGYRRVNCAFADRLLPKLDGHEIIWVHDYHFLPIGAELRKRGCQQKMGFFLHIPWPPPQVIQAVPGHEWLVRSLFAYDLIGFQTQADRRNFVRYVREEIGGQRVDENRVSVRGRKLTVKVFPIGIDVQSFQAMADSREGSKAMRRMRQRNQNHTQIVGADRLDYSKGLPNRFHAFRSLLEMLEAERDKNLQAFGRVTLMQITPPSREKVEAYAELRRELEQLSGEINGNFSEFDWTPIRYIHRNVGRAILAGIFRVSRIGLVTPLRDGMNLVAKEYIAAQEPQDPGVLVLSRFAGAAETMTQALIVNPYDEEQMADTLMRALAMPLAERIERHQALLQDVHRHDINAWRQSFLKTLQALEPQDIQAI